MQVRSRFVVLGAVATLALATGCPASKLPNANNAGGPDNTVSGAQRSRLANSATVHGTVSLPASMLSADGSKLLAVAVAQPLVGANVTLKNELMAKAPNAAVVKTDNGGKYRIKSAPSDETFFVTADWGGVTLASLVATQGQKDFQVDLTLASTVASAGLLPLLVATDAYPRPYNRADIDPARFAALVAAVDAAVADRGAIALTPELKGMTPAFNGLKAKASGVKTAYDALFADLSAKAAAANKSPTAAPGTAHGSGASASPGPASSAGPSGGPSASPTGTSSASAAPGSSPAAGSSVAPGPTGPIAGTITQIGKSANGTITVGTAVGASVQMAVVVNSNNVALFIADGNRLVVVDASDKVTAVPASMLGQNFTNVHAICGGADPATAYLLDVNGGNSALITLNLKGAVPSATSQKLSGDSFVSPFSMAYRSASKDLLIADQDHNALETLDPATGVLKLYAGQPGTAGAIAAANTSLASAQFNKAAAVVVDASVTDASGVHDTAYVLDQGNHAISQLQRTVGASTTQASFAPWAGGQSHGLTDGPALQASFYQPSGLFLGGDGYLYIADYFNNAIRRASTANPTVTTYFSASQGNPNGQGLIKNPQAVALFQNAIYAVDGATGGIWKFVPTP